MTKWGADRFAAGRTIAAGLTELLPVQVLDRPPRPNETQSPHIAVVYSGATDTEFLFTVEVVQAASTPSVADSYEQWLGLVSQVEAAIGKLGFGPPGDESGWESSIDAWHAAFNIQYPRDDF